MLKHVGEVGHVVLVGWVLDERAKRHTEKRKGQEADDHPDDETYHIPQSIECSGTMAT